MVFKCDPLNRLFLHASGPKVSEVMPWRSNGRARLGLLARWIGPRAFGWRLRRVVREAGPAGLAPSACSLKGSPTTLLALLHGLSQCSKFGATMIHPDHSGCNCRLTGRGAFAYCLAGGAGTVAYMSSRAK